MHRIKTFFTFTETKNSNAMKKVTLLAALLTVSIAASAQLRFGVKAGANVYSFSQTTITDGSGTYPQPHQNATKYGGFLGGYASYSFSELMSLQGELLLALQSNTYALNVPLLAELKPFNDIPLSIMAGAQLGVMPSVDTRNYYYTHDVSDSDDAKLLVDFSLAAGVQYSITNHLNVGLRYVHGFVNTVDSKDFDNGVMRNHRKGSKNRIAELSIGWTF